MNEDYEWPWEYNFPPFYTLQVHTQTQLKQVAAWRVLILDYFKAHKICVLDLRDAAEIGLFRNATVNRTLDRNVLKAVLKDLENSGHAIAIDKTKQRWHIFWFTLEEFADLVYDYITETNNLHNVLTLFELIEGEEVTERAFYKLNEEVFVKVLNVLKQRGKCEMIVCNESKGVKFF